MGEYHYWVILRPIPLKKWETFLKDAKTLTRYYQKKYGLKLNGCDSKTPEFKKDYICIDDPKCVSFHFTREPVVYIVEERKYVNFNLPVFDSCKNCNPPFDDLVLGLLLLAAGELGPDYVRIGSDCVSKSGDFSRCTRGIRAFVEFVNDNFPNQKGKRILQKAKEGLKRGYRDIEKYISLPPVFSRRTDVENFIEAEKRRGRKLPK